MLSEILLESLHFLDRASLEAYQLVSRKCKTTIDKSNSTLALRPMGMLLIEYCTDRYHDGLDCAVSFHRSAAAEPLKRGLPPFEALVVVQEMVARTRNMHIDCVCVRCIECSTPFFAVWRVAYDDGRPSKVSSVILDTACTLTVDVKALFQPFISTKLGVASCEVSVDATEWNEGMFDMFWSACDGRMAQSLKVYAQCRRSFLRLLERLLATSAHGNRHYSLVGIRANLHGIFENYIEQFADQVSAVRCTLKGVLDFDARWRKDRNIEEQQRRIDSLDSQLKAITEKYSDLSDSMNRRQASSSGVDDFTKLANCAISACKAAVDIWAQLRK